MCIGRHYGEPGYFKTFTTNPDWPEIRSLLINGEKPRDQPDVCARVFQAKYDALMDDVLKHGVRGRVIAHSPTIERQKRGLTHAHTHTPRLPEDIDKIISAELPVPSANPKLFDIVEQAILHGPCGVLNPRCVCMEASGGQSTCSKKFPKQFSKETFSRKDGIPEYKRRGPDDGGHSAIKAVKGNILKLDNSWVVPFNLT